MFPKILASFIGAIYSIVDFLIKRSGFMTRYLSTCVAGFAKAVQTFLLQDMPDVHVVFSDDGCVVYETNTPENMVNLPYVNNTFLVLDTAKRAELLVEKVIADIKKLPYRSDFKSFKIFVSVDGKLTALSRPLMARLVDTLKKRTHRPYMVRGADGEFWVMQRQNGQAFFLFRLTTLKKKPARGELRPEIAYTLCRLSCPKPEDVFLDPFCGSGTLALTRSRLTGYRGIFAYDSDATLIEVLKQKTKMIKSTKFNRSFFIKRRDFFENGFQDGFIDVIVTDPPWGIFKTVASDFYQRFIAEAARIIKSGGRMIVLTACKNEMDAGARFFKLEERYDILVSGQKAGVFVLRRL